MKKMSPAALSMFAYGLYIGGAGLGMLVAPQLLSTLADFPAGAEVSVRFTGILAIALGYYDIRAARVERRDFFEWSVGIRTFAFVAFAALYALSLVPLIFLLLGIGDVSCALWTWLALRASPKATTPPQAH